MPETIQVPLELTKDEAWHLALFLKRVTWHTCERLSDGGNDREQAQKMVDAVSSTETALRKAGYAPR